MAAEPSQFLNEMPLDLIEDKTRGNSWLSFAKSAGVKDNKHAINALKGENREAKKRSAYAGKTYNNTEAIAEFFKNKKGKSSEDSTAQQTPAKKSGIEK